MIVRSRDLFNRNVRVAITTKEFGSLHPKRPDFAEQLARLLRVTNGGDVALFPQLGFTDQLAWATGARSGVVAPFPDRSPTGFAYWFVTPAGVADRPEVAAFEAWLSAELDRDVGRGDGGDP